MLMAVRKSHVGCKGAYDLSALSHFNAIILTLPAKGTWHLSALGN